MMSAALELGRLEGARVRLVLTTDDALWCARMVVGEAGEDAAASDEAAALVSTMLRRYAVINDARLARGASELWGSLAVLLTGTESTRGYSQPVSVYWSTRGDDARLARRARIRSLEWSAVPLSIRQTVLDVLSGTRPLIAAPAVHFAAAAVVRAQLGADAVRVPVRGASNWFTSGAESRKAPEPVVRPLGSPLAGAAVLGGLCAAFALLACCAGGVA